MLYIAPFSIKDSQTLQTLLEEESKKSSKILEEYINMMDTTKVCEIAVNRGIFGSVNFSEK